MIKKLDLETPDSDKDEDFLNFEDYPDNFFDEDSKNIDAIPELDYYE